MQILTPRKRLHENLKLYMTMGLVMAELRKHIDAQAVAKDVKSLTIIRETIDRKIKEHEQNIRQN